MKVCIAPTTYWIEPRNSPWRQSLSVKVCQRTKRARFLAGNCFVQEHRSEQTTGRHTGPNPKQTSFRKWELFWRKPTNPAIGSCRQQEKSKPGGVNRCCKKWMSWLQSSSPQSTQLDETWNPTSSIVAAKNW